MALPDLLLCAFILFAPALAIWLFSLVERWLWMRRVRREALDAKTDRLLAIGMRMLQKQGRLP